MFSEFSEYLQVPKGYAPIYVMLFGYKDVEYKRATQPNSYTFTTIEAQELEKDLFSNIKRVFWNFLR
jgi:hypothetical protein